MCTIVGTVAGSGFMSDRAPVIRSSSSDLIVCLLHVWAFAVRLNIAQNGAQSKHSSYGGFQESGVPNLGSSHNKNVTEYLGTYRGSPTFGSSHIPGS